MWRPRRESNPDCAPIMKTINLLKTENGKNDKNGANADPKYV